VSCDALIKELMNSGSTLIEANEQPHYLEDNNKLLLLDEFFLTYSLDKHETAEDKRRKQFRTSWLRADERESISVTLEEERELKKYEKLQKEEVSK
jgi:hypothetical protein